MSKWGRVERSQGERRGEVGDRWEGLGDRSGGMGVKGRGGDQGQVGRGGAGEKSDRVNWEDSAGQRSGERWVTGKMLERQTMWRRPGEEEEEGGWKGALGRGDWN